MFCIKELQGDWEERGVIGTRIEIKGKNITVLWRGSPVLSTAFSAKKGKDGVITLDLKETGLRYKGDVKDYAQVTSVKLENSKLAFCLRFPITGESCDLLTRTENNRYGNYDIADGEVLPLLAGSWTGNPFGDTFVFKKDTLTVRGETKKIHALKSRSDPAPGEYRIVDADPGVDGLFGYIDVRYREGGLAAVIPVCDAPSIRVVFFKD